MMGRIIQARYQLSGSVRQGESDAVCVLMNILELSWLVNVDVVAQ
jgi:hypothetical protein